MSKIGNMMWLFLVVLLIVTSLIWWQVARFSLNSDLEVVFMDVGQGDAVFIETSDGNQVLVDGGRNDQILRELSKNMSFFDRSIDVIVATHPDSDHIGGLVSVLDRFDVDLFIESGSESDTFIYESLENILSAKDVDRVVAKRGMIIDLGNGIYLRVLFPDRDVSGVDPNTASIVTQLIYGETSFMLTGDSPSSIEKYLSLIYGNSIQSDVLKVGHHGSRTSSNLLFLGFVDPDYSVVSAGAGNSYGHPHSEVIERLQDIETKILNTAKDGSIYFVSDGKKVELK